MTVQQEGDGLGGNGELDAIRFLARTLDDLERLRVATSNRVRAAQEEGDLPPALPALAEVLEQQEHQIRLALQKTWKKHYLYPWSSTLNGVKGGTLLPRLIAEMGDPYIATPMAGFRAPDGSWKVVADGEPFERTLRQLWRYCGLGDPADKQRRGASEQEARRGGNPIIRKRVWLIVDQFIRHRTEPYRGIYDLQKAAKVEAGWKLGHAENHARRIVMKEFLRDMWRTARAAQATADDQRFCGGAGDTEPGPAHANSDSPRGGGRTRDDSEPGAIHDHRDDHCSTGRPRTLVSV